jgi:hypothetical protein
MVVAATGALTLDGLTLRGGGPYSPVEEGGGIWNAGALTLTRVHLMSNGAEVLGGGILGSGGTVSVQNTILARNTAGNDPSDCVGTVTSQGNNLIGDPTGCTIPMQGTDLTGDPGLGAFTDDGTPGDGHFPLLPTSPAINAGNPAACPKQDQLGEPRVGPCDIGAIEFQGAAMAAQ